MTDSSINRPLTVVEHIPCGKSARLLRLACEWDFIPGQMISLQRDRDMPPRLYSIASPPGRGTIDILYNPVPGGELTSYMQGLVAGESILAGPPRGEFCDEPDSASVWIANGTGVAPFLSLYLSGMGAAKTLIQGARWPEDLYGQEHWLAGREGFRYIPCCSDRDAADSCEPPLKQRIYGGRLTHWLQGEASLDRDAQYYLCGSEQMVIQVRQILMSRGIPFSRIISEIYF